MRFTQRGLVAILGFLLCVSLVGNGVLIMRQQQQAAAFQATHTLAAEQIWTGVAAAQLYLDQAHDHMQRARTDTRIQRWPQVRESLELVQLNLYRSASAGTIYAHMNPPAADVMMMIDSYAFLPVAAMIDIDIHGQVLPDDEWRITDLQSDLALLQRLFPQTLILTGRAADFRQPFLDFCSQRRIFIFDTINDRCTELRATPTPR